ncbi:ExbD/TolR family protein [Denitromonas ohlonensis]|uniref:Biopolymer transporter ExbD n=2 Tax=Denitromonas TaxID=139331 RepID=A0A557SMI4_9RHOO|nr:biopolymer transporter ExbD [Denitromonas ohlonensis]TVO60470.1 biopolymer transporter ExbD [Denitromonas ohlonensis]TVO78635.1 biopolymer transporter ExbD [Denitromonas ohlonensis]TVT75498.1 MAG: biopolymer transporter ExbD [Denitromonas halophila]
MQIQNDTEPYDSINVTPMLDLAYVLLVVFIIMTTASVQGLTMNLPKPSNTPSEEKHETKIVQISPEGRFMINGVGVTPAELEAQLLSAKARDPKLAVMVKGDPATQYAKVIEVVDLVNRLQIDGLGLITARIGT